MTKPSRRIRKQREPEQQRLARARGVYAASSRPDEYVATDIVNFSEDDARELERAKDHITREREKLKIKPKQDHVAKRTMKRKQHKLDELVTRGVISREEAAYCEWYLDRHEELYEAKCKIANWAATGGSSDQAFGHWPANALMHPGRTLFDEARESLGAKRWMFERVVLHGKRLGKLAITFRQAVRQMQAALAGRIELPRS